MDIVTLGAALNGSVEYVNSHFKGGSNIQIVNNPDGTQTINASGEVSSEDTVARAEIAAIKDGTNIDSFGDVETALGDKQNTISDLSTIRSGAALGATAVQPETGKGLSTNDFTTAEKTKLDGLAEVKSIGTGLNLDSTTGELTATGGGSGGTTNYNDLSNKPQINSVTLSGNKSLSDLGITYESKTAASGGATLSLVTTGEKHTWDSKQSAIPDLSTIRSGAALGATAVQPESGKGLSSNDFTTAEKTKLAGIAEGAEVNEIDGIKVNNTTINPDANKVVSITVPTTAADVSALSDTTKYAAALSLTINSSTYVITGQLKDQNGDNLGTAQTIDLPLESVVVNGSYDSQTKKVVLTLQNGNTIEFSVADLVSGLQTELSASNKLNPAYINYDSTHRAVSDTEKSTWNSKQNTIDSLHKLSADLVDDTNATNKFATAEELEQIQTNKNNISTANAELIELVDNGAKNVINNTLTNGSTSSQITATVDSDLKVTLSGTTPSNTDASFAISSNKSIPAGTYKGSGCPSGGATDKYRIDYIVNNTTVYRDTGNGIEFTVADGGVIRSQIVVYRGNTAPSAAFAPMVCLKAAWDVSQKYVPYRPTYEETVEQVATNKNNILSKISASDYATQSTGGTVRVWTTTSGGETTLHIANEAPTP